MTDKTSTVTLVLQVDNSKLSQVVSGVGALDKQIASLSKTVAANDAAAVHAGKTLADAFKQSSLQASIKDDQKAIDDLRNSLDETANSAENLQKKASGGFNVEGLRRTGGALSQIGLGDIGGPVSKLGDVAQISKEISTLGTAFTALGISTTTLLAVMGPLAIATAAVAVGPGRRRGARRRGRQRP